ncbi:hypothetical protein GGI19_005323 [Coemansia pectinata]|uniref:Uncharacterized protein n=1 Tax=Coemansia pectinata TaxID=1052879 RepID=A0A9W8GWL7_9FUNG|nr:hypothetical protein GGI19_005323 [Coemansia pectinata]
MAIKNQALVLLALALYACAPIVAGRPSSLRRRHGSHDHDHEHEHEELDCQASGIDDWNTKLHIGAIFIVLVASGIGSFLPVLGYYVPCLHIPKSALTLGKFLGTGVIIATALIHMLPGGTESLGNPCIGGRMGDYGGWPGVLAIMAILVMHLMEFLLSNHAMGKHSHSHGHQETPAKLENDHVHSEESSELAKPFSDNTQANCDAVAVHTHHTHVHGLSFIDAAGARAFHVSTYILELGICLHSVIIGLTLSVASGTAFTTLLVAICFHQLCEGLALGSRLAQMQHKNRAFLRASISAAVFMLITPLGMIIGIGVRYSYQANSPASLISIGVLDSLSAGILLYTGLVNLLAEEFGTLEFRGYGVSKKVMCFAATYIGAGIMALIGKWA